jgi:putative multiple sugar transport system substrate-binding protein
MSRKTVAALIAVVALLFGAAACSGDDGSGSGKKGTVGISMPTTSSPRWIVDGNSMVKQFRAAGYNTNLKFAENVVADQVSQIENMITSGVKVLVIAAVDGSALTDVLAEAHRHHVPVISYDRLLLGSPYVDYYATFDNFKVGLIQAKYIVDKLGLKADSGQFNIELFAGSPDDNNTKYFFNGAMSVFQPYLNSGRLVVRSQQTKITQVETLRWDGPTAMTRMNKLLATDYTSARVDAVLSPYDGISLGVISALKGAGYGSAGKPLPIITGQDAELPSLKSIIAGEQSETVYKDTRKLAKVAVEMVEDVVNKKTPRLNDTTSYANGKKTVPAYLLQPVSVDKSNYKQVLVAGGYYKASQLS